MKKVCVFTLYTIEGASSNFRIMMYLYDLKSKFKVKNYSFWNKKYTVKYINNKKKYFVNISVLYIFSLIRRVLQIIFVASRYDVIIFQKGIIPKSRITLISFLKFFKCKVIVDIDDAVYLYKYDNSKELVKKIDKLVVGNRILYQYYKDFTDSIVIVPTVDYTPKYSNYRINSYQNKCIGWIGTKSSVYNLYGIVEAINSVMKKYPNVYFKMICDESYEMENMIKNFKFSKWKIDTYIKEMAEFTIGIMPLEDNLFNKNKCGFKLIQYMNAEKPVIASNIGDNEMIIGKCGIIADSLSEWELALNKLLYDKNEYDYRVENIQTEFYKKYSYEYILKEWINIIETT